MIKTYDFSDNSTALPLTKAQRVLRSLGDTDSYSPHFFDDGFPKEILHTDAQAVLNVLDDIVFEREELREKLAAAETSANELRRAVAEIIGADPETWPNHGIASLAIAACVALLQA